MDSSKVVLEHPFVTRIKSRTLPTDSPMLTLKDKEQPLQGRLTKKLCFNEYTQSLSAPTNTLS